MKLEEIRSLEIEDIKVVKFKRFHDPRGYFTELFRRTDIDTISELKGLADMEIVQANESFSRKGTVRGMHFQWNPFMGKLVRVVHGHMVDVVIDIRKNSPSFGKAIAYHMQSRYQDPSNEWIWVPAGFAHGNFFLEDTLIQYLCTGEYSPKCEAGISPLAEDIDWTLCDKGLENLYKKVVYSTDRITDKDRAGFSISDWSKNENSDKFIFGQC